MSQAKIREKAHVLMFGLIYPAFLGTYLVTLSTGWKQFAAAGLVWWVVFLLLYFSSQYVESATNDRAQYSWWPQFVADALIVVLFTVVFVSLSGAAVVAETNHRTASPKVTDYLWLAATFFLAKLSRGDAGSNEGHFLDLLVWAGITAAGLGMLGRALVNLDAPALPVWKAFPGVALGTLWLLLIVYFYGIVVRALHDNSKANEAWAFLTHRRWQRKLAWLWSLLPAGLVLVVRALRALL